MSRSPGSYIAQQGELAIPSQRVVGGDYDREFEKEWTSGGREPAGSDLVGAYRVVERMRCVDRQGKEHHPTVPSRLPPSLERWGIWSLRPVPRSAGAQDSLPSGRRYRGMGAHGGVAHAELARGGRRR